jgi:hypothetical protein
MIRATGAKLRMLASDVSAGGRDEDETAVSCAGRGDWRQPSDDMMSCEL